MTLAQAAAFYVPSGRHRHRHLVAVALDDPHYLIRQAESPDAECPVGSAFHRAVKVIADHLIARQIDDIAAGRVLSPSDFTAANWCNDGVFGTAGTEAVAASNRKRGRYFSEPATAQQELFGGTR